METKITLRERMKSLKPDQLIWPLVILLILFGIVIGVFNYQKNIAATKLPTVQIASPKDNTTVTTKTTKITGTVDNGSKVMVANKNVPVDAAGSFTTEVPLNAGQNNITIVVTGKNGKASITTKKVTYNAPVPVVQAKPVASQAVAGSLSSSGPESYWIPEAALIAAAVVGYSMTKRDLAKSLRKQ